MGNTASNVTAGKPKISGSIYVAPLGTTLPTSTTAALDSAFKCLGYVSDDGLSNDNSPESQTVKAWGGDTVLALQTDRPDTFTYELIEVLNEDVLKVVYGDGNVETSNGEIHVKATAEQLEAHAWVIDMVLRDNRAKRIVISDGTLTNLATISYVDNDAVGYGITITATPDSNGVYHHEYIAGESEISG